MSNFEFSLSAPPRCEPCCQNLDLNESRSRASFEYENTTLGSVDGFGWRKQYTTHLRPWNVRSASTVRSRSSGSWCGHPESQSTTSQREDRTPITASDSDLDLTTFQTVNFDVILGQCRRGKKKRIVTQVIKIWSATQNGVYVPRLAPR